MVRGNNEDAFLALPEDGVFAVADGMGGGSAGEVASAMLCERLRQVLSQSGEDSPGLRKYNAQQAIHAANQAVFAYAEEHHFVQMGTTLVLFLLDSWEPSRAFLCHVGDSRAYCLRKNALRQLTHDHNLLELLGGGNGFWGCRRGPVGGATGRLLTRSVGIGEVVVPEWQELEVLPQDRYLLCTDGVSTMLKDREVQEVLRQATTPDEAVAAFRDRILVAGAQDNFTAACLQVGEMLPGSLAPDEAEAAESDYLLKIAEGRKDNA